LSIEFIDFGRADMSTVSATDGRPGGVLLERILIADEPQYADL
jgi:hypothetical protein